MAQVPMLQGPPMMALACRCPELLAHVKAEQNVAVREQLRELLPRMEFCQVCPFWKKKEMLPPKDEGARAVTPAGALPWHAKAACGKRVLDMLKRMCVRCGQDGETRIRPSS
jgi:hypothetical protein